MHVAVDDAHTCSSAQMIFGGPCPVVLGVPHHVHGQHFEEPYVSFRPSHVTAYVVLGASGCTLPSSTAPMQRQFGGAQSGGDFRVLDFID